ncbi:MAG: S8 family serine peptidase, partial [Chloracidobacterium sp.]|nr:S8 family serine peptidase [Chloracidobacterium sp.]
MKIHLHKLSEKTNRIITLVFIVILVASTASAQLGGLVNLLLTGVNTVNTGQASGITATSPNGISVISNGLTYQADSILISQGNGIALNGLDNLKILGANGIALNGLDGSGVVGLANSLVFNGINSPLKITGANGIALNGLDGGGPFSIPPGNLMILGAKSGSATNVSNTAFTGANTIQKLLCLLLCGGSGILDSTTTAVPTVSQSPSLLGGATAVPTVSQSPSPAVASVDPALTSLLGGLLDDSNVNAAVVYKNAVTNADISTLRLMGVLLGERYHVLPVVTLTATKAQITKISQLPTVRAIYSDSTLKLAAEPGNGLTGTESVKTDPALTAANGGQPVNGSNVTVAVLDTGLDSTHGDLSGRVVRNAMTVGAAGLGISFTYPITIEGLPNTDLVAGHGTFVGGVIAGNGARSSGRYTGVAPGA